tara:strand:+ start:826 stop:1344 length:519 start_codon:yes stop_codon:yes gene_type:complete
MNERGKVGLNKLLAQQTSSQTDERINAPKVIGDTLRTKSKRTSGEVEGTVPLGKATITLGGAYDSSEQTQSLPKNKIGIPDNVQKQIYKKVSAGLGYNISPNVKISGFIDRERITGGKGKNTKTVQLSGNMKGNRFVGAISSRDGERVGSFSLVIPFAHGGKVKPRGRKADY